MGVGAQQPASSSLLQHRLSELSLTPFATLDSRQPLGPCALPLASQPYTRRAFTHNGPCPFPFMQQIRFHCRVVTSPEWLLQAPTFDSLTPLSCGTRGLFLPALPWLDSVLHLCGRVPDVGLLARLLGPFGLQVHLFCSYFHAYPIPTHRA